MNIYFSRRRARGFTLVEMIIVIVITGIIGGMVAMFIRLPVQGYVDANARADLADVADTAVRRIARDLRLALPNSVRVSTNGKYLELLLTKSGGRYLSEDDPPGLGAVLAFNPVGPGVDPNQFTVVGNVPAIAPGDFIAVYNMGDNLPDAYGCAVNGGICNLAQVAAVSGAVVTLQGNPFLAQSPQKFPSPSHRFQVVTTPVSYVCDPQTGTLTRYSGYTIQAAQPLNAAAAPLSTAPVRALLAQKILKNTLGRSGVPATEATPPEGCFTYEVLKNVPRGLLSIVLSLGAENSNTGTLRLVQQVQVSNTP
ncbi:prepilin-type N-terminal cleavage/methylation domain-containing protein [Janthinobacterium sp. LS2A]|uniref:prepilin-type N-terminal cleavage/methylation domain-containing protein n=1 Tax=unclassified Janthinobacterium TaxID=2610881 RepID=UPI0029F55A10|nr:prepilin-type N-terminal cleavage/methylation domain-containing protein [Janthinobacterium sp. GMG2]MDX8121685.1 prepilin-type N-terminal cleavage/methylation domain-containing protein [Janthinobacterium sp. GMG2]